MSKAEFLAKVHLEKEMGRWSRIDGASKFLGVARSAGKWAPSGSNKLFSTEEEAAAEYDRRVVAEMGPTAMTNAKFHADPETRKRTWEARLQVLTKKYEKTLRKLGWHCCSSLLGSNWVLPALCHPLCMRHPRAYMLHPLVGAAFSLCSTSVPRVCKPHALSGLALLGRSLHCSQCFIRGLLIG